MKEDQNLHGEWNVYRYSYSRQVLGQSVTKLTIKEAPAPESKEHTCLAQFRLSGFDERIEVPMDKADPGLAGGKMAPGSQLLKTRTWFGEWKNIDVRWDHVDAVQSGLLIGYAADRLYPGSYDTFVAVRKPPAASEAAGGTSWEKSYKFSRSYALSLARTRPAAEWLDGAIIDRSAPSIKFEGKTYDHYKEAPYNKGLLITGDYRPSEQKVEKLVLWLVAVAGPDKPLVVGIHYVEHTGFDDFIPLNPMCGSAIHLR